MKKAMTRIMQYCARAERCTAEVREKLASWEVPDEVQEEILARLYREGFVDDARYARSFTHDKWRLNGWGRIKIRYALQQKDIPDRLIDAALAEIPEREYYESMSRVLSRKWTEVENTKHDDVRDKVYAFGQSRGYEVELIIRWLDMC